MLSGLRSSAALFTAVFVAVSLLVGPIASAAQEPAPIKGEAALKHPAGQAAVRSAELITAGKVDEAMALRTKEAVSEWKKAPADERKAVGENLKKLTPDPKAFAEAVRKNGELSIMGNSGVMSAELSQGKSATYFEREGGVWKVSTGPMVFPNREPVNETRVENADILKHPIGTLALQYLDLIHAGKMDEAKRLATSEVQAKWKTEPASERIESLAYLRKTLPTRVGLVAALQKGGPIKGLLLIEDDKLATLNIMRSEQRKTGPDTTSYTTETTGIAFEMEGGQWRLRQ